MTASHLRIDTYCAEILPADRAEFISNFKKQGYTVLMVGDGMNDSPALSEADVGIAINEGAAIAREVADITIAGETLWELVQLRQFAMVLI